MGKTLDELIRDGLSDAPIRFQHEVRTARGRLAAFVADLPPLFRRLLVGEGLTGWLAIDYDELSDDDRAQFHKKLTTRPTAYPAFKSQFHTGQLKIFQAALLVGGLQHAFNREVGLRERCAGQCLVPHDDAAAHIHHRLKHGAQRTPRQEGHDTGGRGGVAAVPPGAQGMVQRHARIAPEPPDGRKPNRPPLNN